MASIVEWHVPQKDKTSVALINRNEFASKKAGLAVLDAVLVYTHFHPWQLSKMLTDTLGGYKQKIQGRGVELGAGTSVLSTQFVNLFEGISEIYALEYVDEIVKRLQPKVIKEFARYTDKIVPTIGSFDNIELPDGSVDFLFEIESLHHSDNLDITFKEISRVLKPGGIIICYDRVHPDSVTDEMVKAMLDSEYTLEFKRKYGYPEAGRLTRRMNGEHEYRLREWKKAIEDNGMRITEIKHLMRGPDKILNTLRRWLKLPHEKTPKVNINPAIELKHSIKHIIRGLPYAPKEFTFFVAEKV